MSFGSSTPSRATISAYRPLFSEVVREDTRRAGSEVCTNYPLFISDPSNSSVQCEVADGRYTLRAFGEGEVAKASSVGARKKFRVATQYRQDPGQLPHGSTITSLASLFS